MNPNYKYFNEISEPQCIHDLALTYALYLALRREEETDVESFYEDYEGYFGNFAKIVKHHR